MSNLTVEQIEEALRDNPQFMQLLTEQQRYKQQCRVRALDLAFQSVARIVNPLSNQQLPQKDQDYLTVAEKYYDWLIKIIPSL